MVLELNDLWVSKAIAGRGKDHDFCRALLHRGLVSASVLRERLEQVTLLDAEIRARIAARVA